MKLPSVGIPEDLKEKDPILDGFLQVLDNSYLSFYRELQKMSDILDPDQIPDNLLDYFLFENGIAIYNGYTPTQKRGILSNILEIDSKRYTREGLRLFIDSILPTLDVDLKVPIMLNQISFRNPTMGFPNQEMRVTAGRPQRDINPYIINQTANRELILFLYSETGSEFTDTELFDFVGAVVREQLPDIIPDLSYSLQYYQVGSSEVEVNDLTVTGVGTTFTTEFQSGGFIGLYSLDKDQIFSFEIESVDSDTVLTLSPTEDTTSIPQTPATTPYYRPV